jgi:predicted lipoprotein with Yx(FWY)xxD motif
MKKKPKFNIDALQQNEGDGPVKIVMMATLLASLVACAMGTEPAQTTQTAMGPALADSRGMTLYTFDKDASGKSNCNGKCAENWPPLKADGTSQPSGNWSVVTRDDGSKQWAYKGKPLYGWVKDQKPGDTTGNGVNNNTWHVAQP